MIKYLESKIRKINFQLSVRGEIVSIMKNVNFNSNELNIIQKEKINELIALLDLSKNLA